MMTQRIQVLVVPDGRTAKNNIVAKLKLVDV